MRTLLIAAFITTSAALTSGCGHVAMGSLEVSRRLARYSLPELRDVEYIRVSNIAPRYSYLTDSMQNWFVVYDKPDIDRYTALINGSLENWKDADPSFGRRIERPGRPALTFVLTDGTEHKFFRTKSGLETIIDRTYVSKDFPPDIVQSLFEEAL